MKKTIPLQPFIKSKSSFRGFTLIELLTVFSVIGILTAGSFAAFNTYSTSQTLNNTTSDVITMLQTAKSRAQSQVKPSSNDCATAPLYGYTVSMSTPRTYRLYAVCTASALTAAQINTAISGGATSVVLIKTATLPTNLSFTANFQPTFLIQGGNVLGAGSVSISTKTITVTTTGVIQ